MPQQIPESYVQPTVSARLEDRLASLNQQILNRTRLEQIIREFNLYPQERRTAIMEDVVDRMRTARHRRADDRGGGPQSPVGADVSYQLHRRRPAHRDAGHRAARVAVHRREPPRSRHTRRGHEPVPGRAAARRPQSAGGAGEAARSLSRRSMPASCPRSSTPTCRPCRTSRCRCRRWRSRSARIAIVSSCSTASWRRPKRWPLCRRPPPGRTARWTPRA